MATMANVQEAHKTQVLNERITVPEEEASHSIQVVLNAPPLVVLPHLIMNPKENGMKPA